MGVFQMGLKLCMGLILAGEMLLADSSFAIRVDKSLSSSLLNVLSMAFQQDMKAKLKVVVAKDTDKNRKKELCGFDAFLLSDSLMRTIPSKALFHKDFLFQSQENKTLYAFSLINSQYCSKERNHKFKLEALEHWFREKAPKLIESYKVNYKNQYVSPSHKKQTQNN
ncbi:hypothetical protein [Helicobacter cetorum]|uniref:Uncharacterized protein n=1 Tax=Helicobacter cetorum (strain ATCC BAA-540 / CCUG 52418 / MIT 99-5656) TaxID=1163745 RepID=I0ERH1_HELCM|nr:hypothetical protein [Helicobacter cetorum]AFI05540.1 hypothetical protein HCD_02610 [Helicobacter cetorum MIT 99-5656]